MESTEQSKKLASVAEESSNITPSSNCFKINKSILL